MKCEDHQPLAERVARIEAHTQRILLTLQRIEERIYQTHGQVLKNSGSFAATAKVVGVAAAIAAATATVWRAFGG